ncbi:CHAP domain-containing protein, partial [Muricauda sp. TY007]|uniref:CHAP domain-containing protein n=1 Tax=Allomuricauda sp. TY007 TaxID=2683200 RepID=UPI0013C1B699
SEGNGEASFTVPCDWENKHNKDKEGQPRHFYLKEKESGEEFPRAYYVKNPNKTDEENKKNSQRIGALMLKVAKSLERDKAQEKSSAVVLGEELVMEEDKVKDSKKEKRAPWMEIARKETKKAKGLPESLEPLYGMVQKYHDNSHIKDNPNTTRVENDPTSVAWCSSFVSWCLDETEYKGVKSAASRHYISNSSENKHKLKSNVVKVEEPFYGAIAVFSDCDSAGNTKTSGHVGFVFGKLKDGKIALLGGNQGNKLKISPYDCSGKAFYSYQKGNGTKVYKIFRGYFKPKDYTIKEADKLNNNDVYKNVSVANFKVTSIEIDTSEGESSR